MNSKETMQSSVKQMFDRFKKALDPENGGKGNGKKNEIKKGINNQDILDHLVAQMSEEIEKKSLGKTMIFPMSFNILMNDADFQQHRQEFSLIIDPILDGLYEVLNKYRSKYPQCRPGALSWYFQFGGCDVRDNGTSIIPILPGEIVSTASVCTLNLREAASNTTQEINTTVSLRPQNSNLNDQLNLNRDILIGLNMVNDCTFAPKFDESKLNGGSVDTRYINRDKGLADISYSVAGRTTHYHMKDRLITVSGSAETRTQERSIFIVEDDKVKIQHLQIRQNQDTGRFQLAAYHDQVFLNGVPVDTSVGGNVHWEDLPNNSSIFIANSIQLEFHIEKS
ncbi:MAG: hypothetical protein MJZ77_02075 [Bacteroidales bacterium]|nr:hypothetical protein [Bacteroidales bacterium]